VLWGKDGYISGFRFHRETVAWHIMTMQAGTFHDYWVTDGRFHHILETSWMDMPFSMFFLTNGYES
jgi:hypothetical protein